MKKLLNIFSLLTLVIGIAAARVQADQGERPNVVVIISDDQAFHDFGFMGHPVIQTPNLDQLANQSLVFTRGYVTTALCSPSLATMLTGLYPHQHGITGNDPVKGKSRQGWIDRFRQHPQLPALLSDAGYLSLHTGKYWQGDPAVSGFTDSMGATLRHGSKASLGIGRDTMQPIYDFMDKAQDEDKPFLVWYAPFLPHTPHTPPERLLEKYRNKNLGESQVKYYAMVEWLDETCGDLLKQIDDRGLRDNTVVMFISDNGWPHGESGYRGHKLSPWEQGVRTPIMVRWPGKVTPKREPVRLASNLDIPVTVLAAAGIPVPKKMEGINLLDERAVRARDCVFIEDFAHDMAAPDAPEQTLEARGVICRDWKLVVTYANNKRGVKEVDRVFLFKLSEDPKETNNLVDQYPGTVARLMKKMNEWWNPEVNVGTVVHPDGITTRRYPYRTVDHHDLDLKVWWPPNWQPGGTKLPAAAFFFGGGWHGGDINQFDGIASYLAERGMIIITPEYRTGQDGVLPRTCLEDAKSAMRYVYAHADELGIDTSRIAAGGRSAGGHLAAATAFSRGFDAPGDDLSVSCKPAALVLFNPVIDNGPGGFRHAAVQEYWEDFSPLHTITTNPPPTIFITGDQDQYTPIETAHRYKAAMEKQGGRCELLIHQDGVHGSPFHPKFYDQTLQEMDDFLVSLGYLEAGKD